MNRSIILYFVLATIVPAQAFARTIKVGKGHAVTGIQQGIDMAAAGDTVLVGEGIYRQGNIVINKPVVLKGINHPVLDGEKKYELLSVRSPNVTVDGFLIRNSGHSSMVDIAGIKIYNTHHATVINNILEDNFFGIYVQQGRQCTIQNNSITASSVETQLSGNGIHCWKSDSIFISHNSVTGHRDGIYLEFATHSLIEENMVQKNQRYGLHFMFAHNNTYTGNVFRNNGAGVAVMYTRHVTMKDNRFEDNWGDAAYGLLLKEISDGIIEGNHFEGNTSGIFMDGSSRIEMEKNIFKNNGWAIKMQASCMDIKLEKNNFIGNTFDIGTNGSLVLNTFKNNYWDKYEGYDLDKDKVGDIPYRPVSMYSMIVEKNPPAMMLFRSFITTLLDKTEKVLPSLTPENLKDDHPLMKPLAL
ncbi:nitrous oxide reductase family maturation protein NosD [Agriterribacter sp.]|uniref:nitrous oxide reductase family maturation protein NosD n=1 Tax=Agriterribacter sp. TaxID=2821509 RepID=UPI002C0694CE|nr:nitrous oxide reductase family maturation protein NosD [Agriterribacter sp.]HRO48215.1 nitrous oxide reductase family maturation protein NosD [Agriterribacter sp.]HRQ18734.1 nitrous oxide reductase family maturation protein NosD [Agriterribacter sp.]